MICFVGDPHGHFDAIILTALEQRPKALVLLGDLDLERPLTQEFKAVRDAGIGVRWIPGNHDGDRDDWYANLFGGHAGGLSIHGRVVEIAGQRVAGLGGVFREQVWRPPAAPVLHKRSQMLAKCQIGSKLQLWKAAHETKPGLPRRHRVSIWPEDYERLAQQQADILVVHEAPSNHPHGFVEIDQLAEAMGAQLIVHGHHHRGYTAVLPSGIRVIGVGMSGITNDDGQILLPGRRRSRETAA